MKTNLLIIITLLFLFTTIPGTFGQAERETQPTSKAQTTVYICLGKSSVRYHQTDRCNGLSNCKSQIKSVTLQEAEKMGRTPCKVCY